MTSGRRKSGSPLNEHHIENEVEAQGFTQGNQDLDVLTSLIFLFVTRGHAEFNCAARHRQQGRSCCSRQALRFRSMHGACVGRRRRRWERIGIWSYCVERQWGEDGDMMSRKAAGTHHFVHSSQVAQALLAPVAGSTPRVRSLVVLRYRRLVRNRLLQPDQLRRVVSPPPWAGASP